jgi:hypothetical protein
MSTRSVLARTNKPPLDFFEKEMKRINAGELSDEQAVVVLLAKAQAGKKKKDAEDGATIHANHLLYGVDPRPLTAAESAERAKLRKKKRTPKPGANGRGEPDGLNSNTPYSDVF